MVSAARLIPENPIPHRAAASSLNAVAPAEVRLMRLLTEYEEVTLLKKRREALSCALEHLADHLSIPNTANWAAQHTRRIVRAVRRKQDEQLREWNLKKVSAETTEAIKNWRPDRKWATILVRLKQNELTRGQRTVAVQEDNISDATTFLYENLRPAERRAVDLVCGAKPKPKKSKIEDIAIKLASQIRKDWLSRSPQIGRPHGSASSPVVVVPSTPDPDALSKDEFRLLVSKGEFRFLVPLSTGRACFVVSPIVEEFAGAKIRLSGWDPGARQDDDPLISVLVAAVNVGTLPNRVGIESIARAMNRLRTQNQL